MPAPVRTGAVLLQQKPIPLPTRRSTRPGCEWGLTLGFGLIVIRTEGGAPTQPPRRM